MKTLNALIHSDHVFVCQCINVALFLHDVHFVVKCLYLLSTGYPGDSPPSKKLSKSMSVLYHKRSPDFSSSDTLNTSGAGLKSGAESMMGKGVSPIVLSFCFHGKTDLLTFCFNLMGTFKLLRSVVVL